MTTQTRKITIDTAALFTGKAVGLLLGVIRLNFLAGYLGVANFGILNFAVYFTSLFLPLFDLGLTQLITRDLARETSRTREVMGHGLVLKVLIAVVSTAAIAVIMLFSHFDPTTALAVGLTTGAMAITAIAGVFLAALQAHRKMVVVSAANIVNDVVLSVAIILWLPAAPVVSTPLVLTMLIAVLNLAALAVLSFRIFGRPHIQVRPAVWKELLREGLPIAAGSIGVALYTFAGPSILRYTRGDVEVGLFSAGYKLISILALLPASVNQVIYPVFSAFFGDAPQKLEKALSDTLRVLALLVFPLAAGTVVLAPKIFALLYTPQYAPGIIVLQLAILGNIFGHMDWVLTAFLLAGRRQVFYMVLALSTGVGTLLAGLLLIPRLGFLALPLLSIATEASLFLFQVREIRRMGYQPLSWTAVLKPLTAAAVMAAALVAVPAWNLFVLVPLGALLYFLLIFLLHGFGEQETRVLGALLARIPLRPFTNS